MPLKYFNADSDTADIVSALRQDGAVVINEQIAPEIADTVLAELRDPFDKVGKFDESNFNGYTTLRVSGVLGAFLFVQAHPSCSHRILYPQRLRIQVAHLPEALPLRNADVSTCVHVQMRTGRQAVVGHHRLHA